MEGKYLLNLVLILCFDTSVVKSSLDAEQVYSLLSNRMNVEVMIIKNDIKEMKSEFEGKLDSLEKQIIALDEKFGHKDTVRETDSNDNRDKHVSENDDNIKAQIAVMSRAFKEEKKYIRSFHENMNRSLQDYKTSVHDLIENIREEGKKDLEAISRNISVAELRQMDEITKLKDVDIRNRKTLDDVTNQQRALDSRVANTENSHTELKATLNDRKIAFSAYVKEEKATKPGDIIHFDIVVSQTGGGYDVSTGTFKCPRSGVYLFYVTLVCKSLSSEKKNLIATLKADNTELMLIVSGCTSNIFTPLVIEGSNMVITHLTEGQTVSVITQFFQVSVYEGISTFTGMFLY